MMQELVLDPKKFPDPHNDHPLNQHEDSSWHAYFRVSLWCCHGFSLLAVLYVHAAVLNALLMQGAL